MPVIEALDNVIVTCLCVAQYNAVDPRWVSVGWKSVGSEVARRLNEVLVES